MGEMAVFGVRFGWLGWVESKNTSWAGTCVFVTTFSFFDPAISLISSSSSPHMPT